MAGIGQDEMERIVKRAVSQLGEHFDSVQIFVTSQEGRLTKAYWHGAGNWYARLGQVGEWLVMQDARAGEQQIRQDAEAEDEED
jgi:hypothetical protein